MTATLSAELEAHIAGRSHTLCWLLRLDLRDGTELACTDHNRELDFDLGNGEITCRPDFGVKISNIQTGTGLDAGNFEVSFPISDRDGWPFTLAAVKGGRFNRCEARLVRANWSDLSQGARKVMHGQAGTWKVEGGRAVAEIRDQRDRLNQTVGRQLQNQCDADYADQIECFATPTEITGTITAATNASLFTVSYSGSYADAFFDRGLITGLTGVNANVSVPVWSWTVGGNVETFFPFPSVPEVGDTFTIRDGCARTRAACMAHGQILNNRGFPEVPGVTALKPALPKNGGGGGGKGK